MTQYIETFQDGTVFERDWTAEELAQFEIDRIDNETRTAAAAAAEAERLAATAAALAHARSLGFTDEMIAVMYPGLVEADISPPEPEPTFADLTKRDEPPIVDP